MARRAQLTAATRERVLRAALDLIVEVGPDAVTLQAVAERADVAPGTIYYHFNSRDQLFAAAYDMLRLEWEEQKQWETTETAPAAQLRSLIRSCFRDYAQNAPLLRVILRLRGSRDLEEAVARVRARRRAIIAEILRNAESRGALCLPLARAITITYSLTSFSAWQTLVEEQGLSPQCAEHEVAEFLVSTLFPSSSR
ncbi:MAG: TetR/AcrR family transcriptional regulator [Chloroflexota bacterium]|nr:TetR/AcrR family transcriptional regulator [Dehalococcoidia bacterium]MDW8253864.1 TetR/AcrR family transcriptional regulator [Chloroflexota bacterium]